MPRDDPADDTSLIFTEKDVYMICGYLAEMWGVGDIMKPEDTEKAITIVLQHNSNLNEN